MSGGLCPLLQEEQDPTANISASSGLDQEIGEVSVIRRDDDAPDMPVPIQHPSGEKQGCSLVCFTEGLGPGDPIDQYGGGLHGIINGRDRGQGRAEPFQVVRLVEPLLVLPNRLVEGHGQLEAGSDQ